MAEQRSMVVAVFVLVSCIVGPQEEPPIAPDAMGDGDSDRYADDGAGEGTYDPEADADADADTDADADGDADSAPGTQDALNEAPPTGVVPIPRPWEHSLFGRPVPDPPDDSETKRHHEEPSDPEPPDDIEK